MKKIYISGAITPTWLNRRPIHEAETHFKAAYWKIHDDLDIPINPFEISPYSPEKTWSDYMKDYIEVLVRCDAIYMMKGWWKSKGAWTEFLLAKTLGLEIIYENKYEIKD